MSDNPDTEPRDGASGTAADGENAAGNAKGQDPSVIDDKGRKLTGTGAPGSHSALFGLTPDGNKENDASYESTTPGPAHSGEDGAAFTSESRDGPVSTEDTGSRAPAGSGVHEQLDDPRVAQQGHGGGATTTTDDEVSGAKPGGGSSVAMPSQGSGQVGQDA